MDKKEAFEKLTSVREFFTVADLRNFYKYMLIDYIHEGGDRDYCDFEETSIENHIRNENLSYWGSSVYVREEIITKVVDLLFPLVDKVYNIFKDNSEVLIQRLLESQEWRTLPNEYTE